MNLLHYLIPFLLALGLLVFVHEYGHYWVARRCGVKVLRFSLGFGKPLVKWRLGRDQTEWALAAFPLGGYVKMLDEQEAPVAQDQLHRAFNRQSLWKRSAIVVAGPLANFLLAILLYWGMFTIGTEEPRPRLALTAPDQVDVATTPAAQAGIEEGDLVLAAEEELVHSWSDLRWILLREMVNQKTLVLKVRTDEGVEALRKLDLSQSRIGQDNTDPLRHLGLRLWQPRLPPEIGRVVVGAAAHRAGMESGDRIIEMAGESIESWEAFVTMVRANPGKAIETTVLRKGQALRLLMTPDTADEEGGRFGRVGAEIAAPIEQRELLFTVVRYGIGESLLRAVYRTWDTSVLTLRMIGRMFTGQVSWKTLSGPVTIADYAGKTAKMGWEHYLNFIALISISLGVLNLLPIPVLDGGRLLYYGVEIIKGSPLSERAMEIGQHIGLIALAVLMVFAFYNDINRLFPG